MSEVNIDADLIRSGAELSRSEEKLVDMTNGCICCTLRDDLLSEVGRLAQEGRFDYLLLESTGIAGPLPVAATFDFRDADGAGLSDLARLDTMVTVVDVVNLTAAFSSHDFLADRGESLSENDRRDLVSLLTCQIEFADMIVLNRIGLAGSAWLDLARKIVWAMNPEARVIETDFSRVAPADIFNTGLFDVDRAHLHPMWAQKLYGFADHQPATEEYGISSFVYRVRQPFYPQKIHDALHGDLPGVIRAKGHFRIAARPDRAVEFSLAGVISGRFPGATPLGSWWAAVPRDRWPTHPDNLDSVLQHWAGPWGDRRQEPVFIGADMDEAAIRAVLDAALMAGDAPDAVWRKLPDPFPDWCPRPR